MGLLSDEYVWITVNPIADALVKAVDPSQIAQYNGVMYIDGYWNRKRTFMIAW